MKQNSKAGFLAQDDRLAAFPSSFENSGISAWPSFTVAGPLPDFRLRRITEFPYASGPRSHAVAPEEPSTPSTLSKPRSVSTRGLTIPGDCWIRGEFMGQIKWWQRAVFYQIYPRSFADGNGDGIGDLAGMIHRLDYLRDLGIDAIWLSPHYPSPLFDCGYDVADYTAVAPEYGSLDDFKRFLDGAHQRGIRVILDFVLNHTSDRHPWFLESKSSRTSPKRDWYVWRDGKDGAPPNNWMSVFGGPAWEFDPATEQFYYHFFFKQQPDLNWRNPAVKEAMFDAARFWLRLGVDGFRLDAIGTIFEDPDMPNHTASLSQAQLHRAARSAQTEEDRKRIGEEWERMYRLQVDQPGIHELMRELRSVVDEFPDRVLVGEAEDIAYHGIGDDEMDMVFNFPLMKTDRLTPAWVRANQMHRHAELPVGAWPCNTLGNHDSSRIYNRYGDGQNNEARARLSLALMLTLKGTPFLYNGEEIGMTDLLLTDIRQFKDMAGVWTYNMEIDLLGTPPEEAIVHAARAGRDRCRTPMQWSNAPNAGFCPAGVTPWLSVNPDYGRGVNVEDQLAKPDSLLHFYRRLLTVRRITPALVTGDYLPLHERAEDYLAFLRGGESVGQTCLVILNMSDRSFRPEFDLPAKKLRPVFSSHSPSRPVDDPAGISIHPFEIYIAELI